MKRATLLAAAILVAGCGGKESEPVVPLLTIPEHEVKTPITGATASQRRVLREILAGLGATTITRVSIAAAGEPEAPPGASLRIDARPNDRYGWWQAATIADVFEERSRELALPRVAWLNSGTSEHALQPSQLKGDPPGLMLEEARGIGRRVAKAAEEHGGEVVRLELVRPYRLAFVVVLEAEEPAEFLLFGLRHVFAPFRELLGSGYDGYYVEVRDGDGSRVLTAGRGYSVRDDVAGCSPVLVIGGVGFRPPPCPAKRHWLVD